VVGRATGGDDAAAARGRHCEARLNHKRGGIIPALAMRLGRSADPAAAPICNDRTVSAVTHVIHKRHTSLLSLSWVCSGHPTASLFLPVHLGVRGVPRALVTGDFWQAAEAAYRAGGLAPHTQRDFERAAARETERIEAEAWRLRVQGRLGAARDLLTAAIATLTAHALADIGDACGSGN
jgi:hypothetical protein